MARKRIPAPLRRAVLDANAGVCCVCKTRGVGVELHHLDHDPGNNVAANLAVLCVRDHDAHHRPSHYPALKHLEEGTEKLREYKARWEATIADVRQPNPRLLATLNAYGSEESVHSMRLVIQRVDGTIELERLYHLTSAPMDDLTDRVFDELAWLSPSLALATISEPLPLDHCPCCRHSYANVVDPGRALKIVAPDWGVNSSCSVYVNPRRPSLAVVTSYGGERCDTMSLHKCGKFLHIATHKSDRRIPIRSRPSVRAQAAALVREYLRDWEPAQVFIGTGSEDDPMLIPDLMLPRCWERRPDA